MKKSLSILTLAVAVFWCTTLGATSTPDKLLMKTHTVENTHLVLQLANLQQQKTVVSISDFAGTTYSRQTITDHNGYSVSMDLEQLPEGRYVLLVSQNGQQMKQIIYKNENMLLVSKIKAAK
jgi:hypothetical protein